MPLAERPNAQTADHRRIDLFRMRRDASGAPDLYTTNRVLSCGLNGTFRQWVERRSSFRTKAEIR
jgi:hypothetical protein